MLGLGNSGVLVPFANGQDKTRKEEVKRGWDWRAGLPRTAGGVKGEVVLRLLRLGLAREVGRIGMGGAAE
jgi:hypothetical protein